MLSHIRFALFVGKHGDDVRNGPPPTTISTHPSDLQDL